MKNFTTSFIDTESQGLGNIKPRTSTIEIIRQYARACTSIQSATFATLIAN